MRWLSALIVFACLLLSLPAVIDPGPAAVGWDDAHYLHRASCITHAVFQLAPEGVQDCLALVVKGPLMAWLSAPWGPRAATEAGVGLPLVSLAVLSFGVIIVLAETMVRLAIPRVLILLAFACLTLNPLLASVAGAYESDTLVSLLVALLVMLVPLELRRPNPGTWQSIGRGLAWGGVMALGVMAKTSFGFFAVALAPLLVVLRASRSGVGAAALAVLACGAAVAPVVAYHLIYWDEIVGHVLLSAAGPLAKYTSYGLTPFGYLAALFGRYGSVPMVLALLAAVVGWRLGHQRPTGLWALVWPVAVLVVYIGLTAASENHDMRYGLPFLVGLPFALVALTASDERRHGCGTRWLLGIGMVMILLAVPMTGRPDLRYVHEARAVLATLPQDRPFTLLVASDDSAINFETFRLAQQLELKRFRQLHIDTVVYDEALGHPMAEVLDRLGKADGVVMLKAPIRKAPEWTNRNADTFRAHLQSLNAVHSADASPLLELFRRGGD